MRAAVLATSLLAFACTRAAETDAARAAVQRFFEAVSAGDCASLGRMMDAQDAARCPEILAELQEHDVQLVDVIDAQVDGRDRRAVIVKARLSKDGSVREEPALVRAVRGDGGWRIKL